MKKKNLDQLVEEQMKKSKKFFEGKPEFTKEQLDAIDNFADKKSKIFKEILKSPEQLEKAKKMLDLA